MKRVVYRGPGAAYRLPGEEGKLLQNGVAVEVTNEEATHLDGAGVYFEVEDVKTASRRASAPEPTTAPGETNP